MDELREEIEKILHLECLHEGEKWFVISSNWWKNFDQSQRENVPSISNEELIDLNYSSKETGVVILKPMLAEGQDYRVVSEKVWKILSREFGFDWEISRSVIAVGVGRKLKVDIYPLLFLLFYWRQDLDDVSLVKSSGRPVVLIESASSSLHELETQIWNAMRIRLSEFFPKVPEEEVQLYIRLCYRDESIEKGPWLPFSGEETALSSSSADSSSYKGHLRTLSQLQLNLRDHLHGEERFHHLLVETRFLNRENPSDWRNGRYFSVIDANKWRYELQINQIIDAVDTDKKWYESRVMDMDDSRVKIHFRGWTPKWDEWLPRDSDRIAPLHTKVPNWRMFRVNDPVQIGFDRPGKSFPEWRNGTVIEVEESRFSGDLKVKINYDDKEEWRDAQDELLCQAGTHKAVNAPKTAQVTTSSYSSGSGYTSYGYGSYGRGRPEYPGVVGLQNLGNTCFMNSMLQCLMNTKPLKDYFLQERDGRKLFEQDINHDNPLGMQGKIAINFAKVVSQMWSGEYTVVSPVDLKRVIGEYAPQFAGYQQQDSQEVMNFLLDGLHEDLNRVKKKPYTTPVEHNGRDDETVAKEEWAQYLRRNDSIIVDNFMGQLRSHVICSNPNCANESITFDPFMSLSVPIPDEASLDIQVKLFWADGKIPTKYLIQVKQDAVIADVKDKLTSLSGVVQSMLFFVHVLNHRITSGYKDNTLVEDVRENTLHVYELDYPVDNYKFCSSMLRSSVQLSPTAAGFGNNKHMLLVALLHQAPCASPSDSRSDAEEYDFLEDEGVGNKQRRVELELFNTPLLVSLNSSYTKAEIHQKVWQVVQRLLSESAAASFGCGEGQSLPYRLHLTKPTGIGTLVPDFPNLDEPSELPDANETPFCFTLEWSRHGYQQGYDEAAAKRVAIHESMSNLSIQHKSHGFKDSVSLLGCISKFTEREQLGTTDTWYCPKCKEHVRAFKKFDLFTLPKILIVHLKRFRYAQSSFYMHRDKITTLVTFPIEYLDLAPFVLGPQSNQPLVYDLFAVSEHSGGLGGGHYTATAKNPDNQKWYCFNDSSTSQSSADDAVTPRAYVLFYMRRDI